MPLYAKRIFVAMFVAGATLFGPLHGNAQPVVATGAAADQVALAAARGPGVDIVTTSPELSALLGLFGSGSVTFRPGVHYRYVFADGLNSARGHSGSSYIQSITPSFVFAGARHWTLTYAPSYVAYSNPAFRDTLDQFANIQGQWRQSGWSAMFAQQYSKSDTPLIESGRQTGQQTSTTRLALDGYTSDFSYGLSANQQLNFIQGMTDTFAWSVQPNASYRFADSLSVGIGATAGYVLVYHSPDLESVRPTADVQWQMTRKTSFDVTVGYDDWWFISGDHRRITGLYYSGGLAWRPFTWTVVTVSALQSNSSAPFREQASRNRTFSVGVRQRLLQHFHLQLTMDNQATTYVLDAAMLGTARADRIRSYSVTLSTTFLQHGTASLLYRRSRDNSSQSGFSFSSGQVGFELGFAY